MLRGRYDIISKLGEGGIGETYLAIDKDLPDNYQCVIKKLKPQNVNQTTIKWLNDSFEREAKILQKLGTHDQIPRLLAFFSENQEFYLVQEYVEGLDLRAEFSLKRQFNQEEVMFLLQQILEVLEYVHEKRVIHRDLKPENLMMRRVDSKIVLIDFGAIKEVGTQVFNRQGQKVKSTFIIGTPGYMPIEQIQYNPMLCSDIYAVGMIALEALTGVFPTHLLDSYTGEVVWKNRVQVRVDFAEVLEKMVAYHPSARYQSASEALKVVQELTKTVFKPPKSTSIPQQTIPLNPPKPPKALTINSTIQYAGFWRRLAAHCIDFSILLFISFFLYFINSGIPSDASEFLGGMLGYYILLAFLYSPVMESFTCQGSIGKMALGIIVTDLNGKRLSWGQANRRHISKLASYLLFLIGFIMVAFTQKKQALHDKISGCLVLRKD